MTRYAGVQLLTAPQKLEAATVPIRPADDLSAVLAVEAAAICGSDIGIFRDTIHVADYPTILGHEPVGIIEEIGDGARQRWGVEPGDRVFIEAVLPCGLCEACRYGHTTVCNGWPGHKSYGFLGSTTEPFGPNGAFSTHMWLHPNTRLHPVSRDLPLSRVAMFNALAAGVQWAATTSGLRLGQTVVVFGPGQRGLSCVIAARAAGAGMIIVTGLPSDKHKLELAKQFGADAVLDAAAVDVPEAVRELTGGRMADIAVDVSSGSTKPVVDAIASVKRYGTVVLAGIKEGRTVDGLRSDDIVQRGITVRGVAACDSAAFDTVQALLADPSVPVEQLHTHAFPLAEAETAIRTLAGETGESVVGVSIRPGGDVAS
jgi:threonine dehydrogenase-like Zn-dependent dehydrogenase